MKRKILCLPVLAFLGLWMGLCPSLAPGQQVADTEEQLWHPPKAMPGLDIITYVGQPTEFHPFGFSADGDLAKYEWDFDGDGIFDWESRFPVKTTYTYRSPGTYYARLRVTDWHGITDTDLIEIVAKVGTGKQEYVPYQRTRPSVRKKGVGTKDGVVNRYVIMIQPTTMLSRDLRFWGDVEDFMYPALVDSVGYDPDQIYLLNYQGVDPDGENPDSMIDYPASLEYIDTVFNRLMEIDSIDGDDILYIWITGHGRGYHRELKSCGYTYSLSVPAIVDTVDPTDDQDRLESDFKLTTFYRPTYYDFGCLTYGMYQWVPYRQIISDTVHYHRTKYVSRCSTYIALSDSVAVDNDLYIERFHDYLLGDLNHDGLIDTGSGEREDWNQNDTLPYDPEIGFDEGDWGEIDTLLDDVDRTSRYISGHWCCLFDCSFDSCLDIDVDNDSGSVPQVDGTDTDNAGIFDGIDMNSDGDMDDWVSIDELVDLNPDDDLFDDYLAEWVDSLDVEFVAVIMMNCFSGGFIDDLSAHGRVIMTPCGDEETSAGNEFIRAYARPFLWESIGEQIDTIDADGCASMVEIFNYAAREGAGGTHAEYDDNGDGVGHRKPIPREGEGALGRFFFFEDCSMDDYLIHYSHLADDSVFNDNDFINPKDTILMSVGLLNRDLDTAKSVVCTLRVYDSYIELLDSVNDFGTIPPLDTAVSDGDYAFWVDSLCPDSHSVTFYTYAYDQSTLAGVDSFDVLVVHEKILITPEPGTLFTTTYYNPQMAGKGKGSNDIEFMLDTGDGFDTSTTVSLSASGFCSGINGLLLPKQVTVPDTATLSILIGLFCQPKICSTIVVTATGGGVTAKETVTVAVRSSPVNQGPIWHVDTTGHDLWDGKEDYPLRTIRKGVELASAGDTVLVKQGTYYENVLIDKDSIVVTSYYARDEQESYIESTVIDAQDSGWVVTIDSCDEVTLHGFTIRNGENYYGGYGGGVSCLMSNYTIEHSIITENALGIKSLYDQKPDILHNTITANTDAIKLEQADSGYVFRNLIFDNSGRGIALSACWGTRIANNSVSANGSEGLYISAGSQLVKNTVASDNEGYGVRREAAAAITFWFNDVFGNEPADYFGMDTLTGSDGNISQDPRYGDLDNGNLHLQLNSPCIDSGDTADSVPPGGGDRIDMGAIEYTCSDTICGDANRDCIVDWGDVDYLNAYFDMGGPGPPPNPLCVGDANCDGSVSFGDVIYLTNYLNGTGEAPCDTCCQE